MKIEEKALRQMGEALIEKAFGWGFSAGLQSREIMPDEKEVFEKHKQKYVPMILRDFLKEHYSNENKKNEPEEHKDTSSTDAADTAQKLTEKDT